jgi:hypothetical protein
VLDEGIAQATDMLVYDFSSEGRAQWDQKFKHESATVKGISYAGHAVRQGPDWAWMRSTVGFGIPVFQGYHPVSAADPAPIAAPVATAPATPVDVATPAPVDAAAPAAAPEDAASPAAAPAPAAPAVNGAQ